MAELSVRFARFAGGSVILALHVFEDHGEKSSKGQLIDVLACHRQGTSSLRVVTFVNGRYSEPAHSRVYGFSNFSPESLHTLLHRKAVPSRQQEWIHQD